MTPAPRGRLCRLLAWSNLPLILSEQALLLLISPTFPSCLAASLPHRKTGWEPISRWTSLGSKRSQSIDLCTPPSLTKGWGNWIAHIHFWKNCRKSKGNMTRRGGMVLQGKGEKTVQVMPEAKWEFMGRSPHWLSKLNGCRNRQMAAQGWEWWKKLSCGALLNRA